jgi:putative oxidoreductase
VKKQMLYEICIALIILLFSYTALSKILDQYRFVFQMRLSPFYLVRNFASVLGWLIPFLEIIIVIGILFSPTKKIALGISLGLLILFELYIGGMLLSGRKLPCACGGVIAFMSWQVHLLFNATFILINILALKLSKRQAFGQMP